MEGLILNPTDCNPQLHPLGLTPPAPPPIPLGAADRRRRGRGEAASASPPIREDWQFWNMLAGRHEDLGGMGIWWGGETRLPWTLKYGEQDYFCQVLWYIPLGRGRNSPNQRQRILVLKNLWRFSIFSGIYCSNFMFESMHHMWSWDRIQGDSGDEQQTFVDCIIVFRYLLDTAWEDGKWADLAGRYGWHGGTLKKQWTKACWAAADWHIG